MSRDSGRPRGSTEPLLQQRPTCSTREGSTVPRKLKDRHPQHRRGEAREGLSSPSAAVWAPGPQPWKGRR